MQLQGQQIEEVIPAIALLQGRITGQDLRWELVKITSGLQNLNHPFVTIGDSIHKGMDIKSISKRGGIIYQKEELLSLTSRLGREFQRLKINWSLLLKSAKIPTQNIGIFWIRKT